MKMHRCKNLHVDNDDQLTNESAVMGVVVTASYEPQSALLDCIQHLQRAARGTHKQCYHNQ